MKKKQKSKNKASDKLREGIKTSFENALKIKVNKDDLSLFRVNIKNHIDSDELSSTAHQANFSFPNAVIPDIQKENLKQIDTVKKIPNLTTKKNNPSNKEIKKTKNNFNIKNSDRINKKIKQIKWNQSDFEKFVPEYILKYISFENGSISSSSWTKIPMIFPILAYKASPSVSLVYLYLYGSSIGKGSCTKSSRTIQKDINILSHSVINKAIKQLVAYNLIKIISSSKEGTLFELDSFFINELDLKQKNLIPINKEQARKIISQNFHKELANILISDSYYENWVFDSDLNKIYSNRFFKIPNSLKILPFTEMVNSELIFFYKIYMAAYDITNKNKGIIDLSLKSLSKNTGLTNVNNYLNIKKMISLGLITLERVPTKNKCSLYSVPSFLTEKKHPDPDNEFNTEKAQEEQEFTNTDVEKLDHDSEDFSTPTDALILEESTPVQKEAAKNKVKQPNAIVMVHTTVNKNQSYLNGGDRKLVHKPRNTPLTEQDVCTWIRSVSRSALKYENPLIQKAVTFLTNRWNTETNFEKKEKEILKTLFCDVEDQSLGYLILISIKYSIKDEQRKSSSIIKFLYFKYKEKYKDLALLEWENFCHTKKPDSEKKLTTQFDQSNINTIQDRLALQEATYEDQYLKANIFLSLFTKENEQNALLNTYFFPSIKTLLKESPLEGASCIIKLHLNTLEKHLLDQIHPNSSARYVGALFYAIDQWFKSIDDISTAKISPYLHAFIIIHATKFSENRASNQALISSYMQHKDCLKLIINKYSIFSFGKSFVSLLEDHFKKIETDGCDFALTLSLTKEIFLENLQYCAMLLWAQHPEYAFIKKTELIMRLQLAPCENLDMWCLNWFEGLEKGEEAKTICLNSIRDDRPNSSLNGLNFSKIGDLIPTIFESLNEEKLS
jgi:hypothetical protein